MRRFTLFLLPKTIRRVVPIFLAVFAVPCLTRPGVAVAVVVPVRHVRTTVGAGERIVVRALLLSLAFVLGAVCARA